MLETCNRIREILSGHATDERIDIFIKCFVFFCNEERYMTKVTPRAVREDNRRSLDNTLVKLKDQFGRVLEHTNAYAYGKSISENNPRIEAFRQIFINPKKTYSEGEMLGIVHARVLLCEEIGHTWDHLYNIHVLLNKIDELEKQRGGRPNADSSEMVYHIAQAYSSCIKMPTSTRPGKKESSGPFYKIIQEAYKVIGKWTGNDEEKEPDVSKPVKDAIKRLKREEKMEDETTKINL